MTSRQSPNDIFRRRAQRFVDDRCLVRFVEKTYDMDFAGQLVPTNLWTDDQQTHQSDVLDKCACPSLSGRNAVRQICSSSSTDGQCKTYYLVFKRVFQCTPDTFPCCSHKLAQPVTRVSYFAVNPHVPLDEFDGKRHIHAIQVEETEEMASMLMRQTNCCQCDNLRRRFAASAQWRRCFDPCLAADCDDLMRDSLVRITAEGNQYWQYKPLPRSAADEVYGVFGHSVFRGRGPKHYLPDHRRRSTSLRGGFVPRAFYN